MTGAPLLLGIDLGTTRIKAVVHRPDGRPVASASAPTPWQLREGGTELDPVQLHTLLIAVAADAAEQAVTAGAGRIAAIGTTGMGESGVLTGRDGQPLAPVPAWHDRRADVDPVRDRFGRDAFQAATGMPLGPQPSLPKLVRQFRTVPGADGAVRFSSVPEWAVRCLGGPAVSELSLASRTGLLDVVAGRPWAGAADLLGTDLLGELVIAGAPLGRSGGVDLPPVLAGATLTVAGHDHQTAALAVGAAADGSLLDSLGTAEALLRFTARKLDRSLVGRLVADGITVGRTVLAGHWCVLHGLRTGFVLERVASALGLTDRAARARIGAAAARLNSTPGVRAELVPDGIRLTLTATGEPDAGPGPRPGAGLGPRTSAGTGTWTGAGTVSDAGPDAGPEVVWAATVAAVVAAGEPGVARVAELLGPHDRVIAAGGWLANPAVLAAKRRQFPGLVTRPGAEAGAAGAAYLAGVAAGLLPAPSGSAPRPWGPFGGPEPGDPPGDPDQPTAGQPAPAASRPPVTTTP